MRAASWALAAVLAATPLAANADLLRDQDAWRVVEAPNKEPAAFRHLADGGLEVRADGALGFYYRETNPGQVLAWRWRVDIAPPPTDQFEVGEDDRAIAVHLWCNREDSDVSFFGGIAELLGYPRITHTLTYVWGGAEPGGRVGVNPYYENGRVWVLRGGDAPAGWAIERRDIAADIQRAFGEDISLEDLRLVALSADTDDSGGLSHARIADLAWTP